MTAAGRGTHDGGCARGRTRRFRTGGLAAIAATLAIAMLARGPGPARGDVIELRGGGQVQGKVVPDPKDKERSLVWMVRGKHPLSFRNEQILRVEPRPGPLDDYVLKRKQLATDETGQAHLELGLWCERHQLPDLARSHFEQALVLDPDLEGPHRKLGHVLQDGEWLTRDDLRAAQGMVKFKGRWITPAEKAKHDADERSRAAGASWYRRIKLLRQSLISGTPDRRREAESQLMSLNDPDAVAPLVRVFGKDDPSRRRVLAWALAAIKGPEATKALAQRVLVDPDKDVRQLTLDRLKQRDDDDRAIVQFVRGLAAQNLHTINRAAWALGELDAKRAVPNLIDALVSVEQRAVMAPSKIGSIAVGPVPAGMGPMPARRPRPRPFLKGVGPGGLIYGTGPLVGPGVVAYGMGAATWPQVFSPGAINMGLSPGMMLNSQQSVPDLKLATITYHNLEVREALKKLTGKDFGFDLRAWRTWLAHSFNPHPKPARRVPQP